MPAAPDDRSLLDLSAQHAVPDFFGMAMLVMLGGLAAMIVWPAVRSHELAPLVNLTLATALAGAGWKLKALHTRRFLAGYWLVLGAGAYVGILQTQSGVDSMLTGSVLICTVMAAQLLSPSGAKACWAVSASALLGLYAAEHQGWFIVQAREPLQGVAMGMALLFLGLLQARFFNRANETARRMLLEQAQHARAVEEDASRAKADFLSVMSHEIRTPLNGIVGLVALVQDPSVDEANRQQYLRMLDQSSQALSNLVAGVLDFSRLDSERLDTDHVAFSLLAWAQDLEDSFAASATVKGLFLQVEVDASAGNGARGDPLRLRQIAAHYLSNAIKFTKAGTVRVFISRPHGDERLRLEVRDSGIGLPEAMQAQIFKPFEQDRPGVHRESGGTGPGLGTGLGLGLSICERLAQLMNGQVGVTSTPGMGSTFWAEVTVPIEPLAERREASPPLASFDLHAARVLVVDDNAVNRTITSQMLRRMNAIVATAADGQEGLDALRTAHSESWPYDLVLMDVQMPGMDGLTAVRLIRQDPVLAATPVVALTAGVLKDDMSRALDAGMDGFLSKPVTAERLARNVMHFVERGRERRGSGATLHF